jgi:hypothetical protein
MSHPSSRSVVISAAVLGLLAGCNGGGDDADAGPPRRSVSEPTSTTATPPREIDLSQPIPGGSLHGTPRPPLENTGDDYVAIVESLVANFRWLSENPDPAVISDLYVPGTDDHQSWTAAFQELADKQWRAADDDYHVVSTEIVDAQPGIVSVRLTDYLGFETIVDAAGQQVGEGRQREPAERTAVVLLAADGAGQWRIADWTVLGDSEVEV